MSSQPGPEQPDSPSARRRRRREQEEASRLYLVVPLAISLGLLVFGVAVIGCNLQSGSAAADSAKWPTVEATVTASEVQGDVRISKRGARQDLWVAVRYEYEVDGRKYESDRASFMVERFTAVNHADAQAKAKAYPPGKVVTAYYNPADPSFAILEPGEDAVVNWIIRIAGGFVALLGIFFLGFTAYRFFVPPPPVH